MQYLGLFLTILILLTVSCRSVPTLDEEDSPRAAMESAPSLEYVVSLLRQGRDETVLNLIQSGELDMTWTDASGGGGVASCRLGGPKGSSPGP